MTTLLLALQLETIAHLDAFHLAWAYGIIDIGRHRVTCLIENGGTTYFVESIESGEALLSTKSPTRLSSILEF